MSAWLPGLPSKPGCYDLDVDGEIVLNVRCWPEVVREYGRSYLSIVMKDCGRLTRMRTAMRCGALLGGSYRHRPIEVPAGVPADA